MYVNLANLYFNYCVLQKQYMTWIFHISSLKLFAMLTTPTAQFLSVILFQVAYVPSLLALQDLIPCLKTLDKQPVQ